MTKYNRVMLGKGSMYAKMCRAKLGEVKKYR